MKVCIKCNEPFISEDWVCPRCGCSPQKKNGYLSFLQETEKAEQFFDSGFYPQLAALETNNFWFRFRNKLLKWAIHNHFPNAVHFLEVGSGTGFVLSGLRDEFPGMKITGSDIYPQGLDYAKERVPDAAFLNMDACNIPFEKEFDLIGLFDILEHIQDDQKVLNQVG
ncbi:MAG TPA: class I SAM-dependent methyltransferase, partial [Clostridia bacterium]|nr:class I SAM-dependent methyltransferase [Clostridia bacterium]